MVDFDGDQPLSPAREFAANVDVDVRYQLRLPDLRTQDKRISNGENPFKVWREYFGEYIEDVAEILDVGFIYYKLIEEGEEVADKNDILKFCRHFGIHPADLRGDEPIDAVMMDVFFDVHDQPELLSRQVKNSNDLAMHTLIDEAIKAYDGLNKKLTSLKKQYPSNTLTIDFVEKLLKLDGRLSIFPIGVWGQASQFLTDAEKEEEKLEHSIDRCSKGFIESRGPYNFFGNRLFGKEWLTVHKNLFKLAEMKGVEHALQTYMDDPKFIGRTEFPKWASPVIRRGQPFTWKQAQREHFRHAEVMFLASKQKKEIAAELSLLSKRSDLFDVWVEENRDLFLRYENRQRILQHSDFKDLKREFYIQKEKPRAKVSLYTLHLPK